MANENTLQAQLLTIRGRRLGLATPVGTLLHSLLVGCLLPVTSCHGCFPHDRLEHKDPAKVVAVRLSLGCLQELECLSPIPLTWCPLSPQARKMPTALLLALVTQKTNRAKQGAQGPA